LERGGGGKAGLAPGDWFGRKGGTFFYLVFLYTGTRKGPFHALPDQ